jgi:putative transposase
VSRKKKGGSNRRKAQLKVARLHAKIANIRSNWLHKLTTRLSKRFSLIGIEDLNVKGMLKSNIARAISDIGMREFRRQLEYKVDLYGSTLVIADRWYPSSKTCSKCGYVLRELSRSAEEWTCPDCETVHDRDFNAAINLKQYAISTASYAGSYACGEEGSGLGLRTKVKPASRKQEPIRVR